MHALKYKRSACKQQGMKILHFCVEKDIIKVVWFACTIIAAET